MSDSPGSSPHSSPEALQKDKPAGSPSSPGSRTPSPSPPTSPVLPESPAVASPDTFPVSPVRSISPQPNEIRSRSPSPVIQEATDSTLFDLDITEDMVAKKSPEDKGPERFFGFSQFSKFDPMPSSMSPVVHCPTSSSSGSSSSSSDYLTKILQPKKHGIVKSKPVKHQTPDLHVHRLRCCSSSSSSSNSSCDSSASSTVQPNPPCSCVTNNTIRVTVQPSGSDGCCATCPYRGIPGAQRLNIQAEIQRPAKTDSSTQTEGHTSDEVRDLLDSRLARHIPSVGGIMTRQTEDRLLVGVAIGCAAAILMKILRR